MPHTVSFRLPENLNSILTRTCKETERSKSYILTKALESYLEDLRDARIAQDRLLDPADRIISSKAMRKRSGLYNLFQDLSPKDIKRIRTIFNASKIFLEIMNFQPNSQ